MSMNMLPVTTNVKAECYQCGKTEWISALLEDAFEEPLDAGIRQSQTWQYAHNAIVCSDECSGKWWANERD